MRNINDFKCSVFDQAKLFLASCILNGIIAMISIRIFTKSVTWDHIFDRRLSRRLLKELWMYYIRLGPNSSLAVFSMIKSAIIMYMYSQIGVGPLLHLSGCSSHVPLLYIFCPPVVPLMCSCSASTVPPVHLLLFLSSSSLPLPCNKCGFRPQKAPKTISSATATMLQY